MRRDVTLAAYLLSRGWRRAPRLGWRGLASGARWERWEDLSTAAPSTLHRIARAEGITTAELCLRLQAMEGR